MPAANEALVALRSILGFAMDGAILGVGGGIEPMVGTECLIYPASLNDTPPSYGRERGGSQGERGDSAVAQRDKQVITGLRGRTCILIAQ